MKPKKKCEKDFLKEWFKLDSFQKAKWNGFKGYLEGKKYIDSSLFLPKRFRKSNLS